MKFSALASKVSEILTDTTNVTWTLPNVQEWLAESERQIILLRPDANAVSEELEPADSVSKQTIPSDSFRLLDIPHNVVSGSPGRAITIIQRSFLDDLDPNWHQATVSDTIEHFVYNDLVPEVFYLYPRPSSEARIEIQSSKIPAPPDFGADPDVTIKDAFEGAMIQYAVWRCLSRADDQSPDAQSAELSYQKFIQLLGLESQSKVQSSPKRRGQKQ